MKLRLCCLCLFVTSATVSVAAKSVSFDSNSSLEGATVQGGAEIVAGKGRDGSGGALRVPPGGVVTWNLRDADGGGTRGAEPSSQS